MPVMDGIQATKEIRRIEKSTGVGGFPTTPQSEGQQTPSEASTSDSRSASTPSYRSSVIIVALTASSLQSDRVAALAAGCNDFLTKPVSLHWLNNKIIEWGSIKALQMWADIRPEVVRSITTGQVAQARDVANKLHVPEGRSTPMAPRSRSSSTSRKPVSLDAAKAAAATLSKADKAPAIASPSDGSPDSTPEAIVKPVVVSADATSAYGAEFVLDIPPEFRFSAAPIATRGCDPIPEVSSNHVQSSRTLLVCSRAKASLIVVATRSDPPEGTASSSSNPTLPAASSNHPAENMLDPSSQNAAASAVDPLGDTPGEKDGPAPTDDDNNRPPPPEPQ